MTRVFRAVLALIIAANCAGLATLLVRHEALRRIHPELQLWMLPALALLGLASIAACAALWSWRRWGFALLLVAYTLVLLINLDFGAPPAHTALGPLGLLVLAAAAWPVRERFLRSAPPDPDGGRP